MAERQAQKQRTRFALLAATRQLLERGEPITVVAAAEEANISKATAYRYFSDPTVMAAEAALDIEVPKTSQLLEGITNVRERVHRVASYYLWFARSNEVAFRSFIIKAFETWLASYPHKPPAIRGARRIPAFREALDPVADTMEPKVLEDLVFALSCITGIELHVALADVCALDDGRADTVARSMVDAILDRYGIAG